MYHYWIYFDLSAQCDWILANQISANTENENVSPEAFTVILQLIAASVTALSMGPRLRGIIKTFSYLDAKCLKLN